MSESLDLWKKDLSKPCAVYLVTCAVNGKHYIGVTSQKLKNRLSAHFSEARRKIDAGKFHKAIRKYGTYSFSVELILQCRNCEEAMAEEVRLIHLFKPEYNTTAGGEGRPGGGPNHFTPEGRARMSAAGKGKKKHTVPHSIETKQRLREMAERPESAEKWRVYGLLGSKSCQRRVLCVSDGKEFEGLGEAARNYNIARSALNELCLGQRGRKTVGGLRFRFAEVLG